MTLRIQPLGLVLFVVACVAGYLVYQHTRLGSARQGDMVGAIGCSAAVLAMLVLLVGGGHEG
ncbi:hypothetical protein ACFQ7A_25300 [Streptomyces sp. NPDC056528]|uniref:hypothetical protein n=1 Tax=Streptomyces sp. NPDC056528 TaxID=3345854 RepID=UPI0036D147A1